MQYKMDTYEKLKLKMKNNALGNPNVKSIRTRNCLETKDLNYFAIYHNYETPT